LRDTEVAATWIRQALIPERASSSDNNGGSSTHSLVGVVLAKGPDHLYGGRRAFSVAVVRLGTGTLKASGKTVSGTGSRFRRELTVGDSIVLGDETLEVAQITSNKKLTLVSAPATDVTVATSFTIESSNGNHALAITLGEMQQSLPYMQLQQSMQLAKRSLRLEAQLAGTATARGQKLDRLLPIKIDLLDDWTKKLGLEYTLHKARAAMNNRAAGNHKALLDPTHGYLICDLKMNEQLVQSCRQNQKDFFACPTAQFGGCVLFRRRPADGQCNDDPDDLTMPPCRLLGHVEPNTKTDHTRGIMEAGLIFFVPEDKTKDAISAVVAFHHLYTENRKVFAGIKTLSMRCDNAPNYKNAEVLSFFASGKPHPFLGGQTVEAFYGFKVEVSFSEKGKGKDSCDRFFGLYSVCRGDYLATGEDLTGNLDPVIDFCRTRHYAIATYKKLTVTDYARGADAGNGVVWTATDGGASPDPATFEGWRDGWTSTITSTPAFKSGWTSNHHFFACNDVPPASNHLAAFSSSSGVCARLGHDVGPVVPLDAAAAKPRNKSGSGGSQRAWKALRAAFRTAFAYFYDDDKLSEDWSDACSKLGGRAGACGLLQGHKIRTATKDESPLTNEYVFGVALSDLRLWMENARYADA